MTLQGQRMLQTRILDEIMPLMNWNVDKAKVWFQTQNPNFGGCSPADMVSKGRGHKVLKFIAASRHLNGSPDTTQPKETK